MMEPFDPIATGRRVKQQREARGWSQSDLARSASIATITVKRIEGGARRGVTLHSFTQVYLALNITPNDLLGVKDARGIQSDTASLV